MHQAGAVGMARMSHFDPSWRDYTPTTGEARAAYKRDGELSRCTTPRLKAIPFDKLCDLAGLVMPIAEYRFAPPRKWRFDWAWPLAHRGEVVMPLALEVQGGVWTQGRHVRGAALVKEFEKLNAAAAAGFRVLFVTPQQIENGEALAFAEKALR